MVEKWMVVGTRQCCHVATHAWECVDTVASVAVAALRDSARPRHWFWLSLLVLRTALCGSPLGQIGRRDDHVFQPVAGLGACAGGFVRRQALVPVSAVRHLFQPAFLVCYDALDEGSLVSLGMGATVYRVREGSSD